MTAPTATATRPARNPIPGAERRKLRALSERSQRHGTGEKKLTARVEFDALVGEIAAREGVTLRHLAEVLGVTESSIHTRVVRNRKVHAAHSEA